MQLYDRFRFVERQLLPQKAGKEVMVTIPLPLVVEGEDEKIARFQIGEHVLGFWLPGNRNAQRPIESFQYRSLQKERSHIFWLTGQHFLSQVVEDKAVGAADAGDELARLIPALQ